MALSVQDVQPSVAQQNQGEPENIEAEAKPPMDKRERQRIRAALLAVVGIGIGGVFLVVVVLIWGARLRRRAHKKPTTTQSIKDEFWYLRSKSAAAETNLDEPHESTGDA